MLYSSQESEYSNKSLQQISSCKNR